MRDSSKVNVWKRTKRMTILYGIGGQREEWLEDIDDIPTNRIPEKKEQIGPGTRFCNHPKIIIEKKPL